MAALGLILGFLSSSAQAQAPAADAAGAKLNLLLTLDKASYALGDVAMAEVKLDSAADRDTPVLELQLEARSLSFELACDGKPPLTYAVNRPNVFFNAHAGPSRIVLGPKKSLLTLVPVPLVKAGKIALTAVYKGGPSPVRSNAVSVDVKAEGGAQVVARIEVLNESKDPAKAKGVIAIQLDAESAPVHVMNFVALAHQGFYEHTAFYRVISDFAIQGGCPQGTGIGDPGYNIANEHKPEQKHVRGTVSMNHPSGYPDAAGSQFFICVKDAPWLDLPEEKYTVFGKVTEGMEVVEEIAKVDTDSKTRKPVKPVTIEKVTIGTK
jgi:peptidyl-prolyl cis-trans isomerase B (cyclophilin B)